MKVSGKYIEAQLKTTNEAQLCGFSTYITLVLINCLFIANIRNRTLVICLKHNNVLGL